MTAYHPDTRYLNDYAAGSLSPALSIIVKAHLEHCPECRQHVQSLEQIGGTLMNQQKVAVTLPENALDKLMAKIDSEPKHSATPPIKYRPNNDDLPVVLDKLISRPLNKIGWKKLARGLNFSRVPTGDQEVELMMYHIKAGRKIPMHTHKADEITLVLRGSFSDADGVYKKGDFVVRSAGEQHSPIATQDEDCLCLAAQAQPIAFTGMLRLLNPMLSIKPS